MKKGEHEDTAMPFGKHSGELIADIPSDYLRWLLEQDWFCRKADLAKQVKIEMEFRDKFDKHF